MFFRTRLACSFCGKGAAEVSKLVAGSRVYICDVCVATASRIMSASDGTNSEASVPSRTLWQWCTDRLSRRRMQWQAGSSQRGLLVQ